jgi:hypothetical protein
MTNGRPNSSKASAIAAAPTTMPATRARLSSRKVLEGSDRA